MFQKKLKKELQKLKKDFNVLNEKIRSFERLFNCEFDDVLEDGFSFEHLFHSSEIEAKQKEEKLKELIVNVENKKKELNELIEKTEAEAKLRGFKEGLESGQEFAKKFVKELKSDSTININK